MSEDHRARLKQLLVGGDISLQPLAFPQHELWETSPVPAADAWLFRQNLFPPDDIRNLGRMYLAVLSGVCRSPEILTSALMTALR